LKIDIEIKKMVATAQSTHPNTKQKHRSKSWKS